MKKSIIFLALGFLLFFTLPTAVRAEDLVDRLRGKILLQTESNGEAWYVDPVNKQRAYLGRPDDVFRVMREFGLGIKQMELNSYLATNFPKRLAGRILLNIEGLGEAYYVSPDDLKGQFLGSPSRAFEVVKQKAVGITNNNINKIRVAEKLENKTVAKTDSSNLVNKGQKDFGALTETDKHQQTPASSRPTSTSTPPVTPGNSGLCAFWTYSPWGECVNGVKTRQTLSFLPENCLGGAPEVSKQCENAVCTSWRYSAWNNCNAGFQLRDVLESFPVGCAGGNPNILKSCDSHLTCDTWTYSNWSPCVDGTQSRSVVTSSPDTCVGGEPVLTQTCEVSAPSPYSPYQFRYVREMAPEYGHDVRILVLSEPNENIKILKIPVTAYYGYSFNDPMPSDLSFSVNYIQAGEQKSVAMTRLNNKDYVFEAGAPIPLNLGDNNSLTIKANKNFYGAGYDVSKWLIWDYSVDKPVWLN